MTRDMKPTRRQRQAVDLIIRYRDHKDPLGDAAERMAVSKQAVKNMLGRIKSGYVDRMEYVEWFRKKRNELNRPGRYL